MGQKQFTQLIISTSPLFSTLAGPNGIDYAGGWTDYMNYKSMVPCCGGILLNEAGDKVYSARRCGDM
jgi:mRNA-decapping enzyme subunit 2